MGFDFSSFLTILSSASLSLRLRCFRLILLTFAIATEFTGSLGDAEFGSGLGVVTVLVLPPSLVGDGVLSSLGDILLPGFLSDFIESIALIARDVGGVQALAFFCSTVAIYGDKVGADEERRDGVRQCASQQPQDPK